jgi:hypothetical protein
MSEETQKNRRRRRRPRASNKGKAKARPKESKNQASNVRSASSGRRGRSRKKGARSRDRKPSPALTVQEHKEPGVSPIDKGIFIYTYTLRPRSLLDGYEAGPNVTERMEFEESTRFTLND